MNHTAISQFKDSILAAGLNPPEEIYPDGNIHRFSSNGKRGDEAGWYVMHDDGAIPAGSFGDWRTDISETWRADIGRSFTSDEDKEFRAIAKKMSRARKAEKEKCQTEAKIRVDQILKEASPCSEHPYLTKKKINAHGALVYDNKLIIPLRVGNDTHSLQFIETGGEKRFLPGGRVSGCYFAIGHPQEAKALFIAEGFATAASIHEATGLPGAVAFNAGNLLSVAKAVRARFTDMPIIICADDDHLTKGNPGITKAKQAAAAVNGLFIVPDFGPNRPEKATDFNDLAVLCGPEAVKKCVDAVISEKPLSQTGNKPLHAVSIFDFLKMEFPPRENLLEPWLPVQGLCMVHAYRGVGKTHLSLGVACAVATGSHFLGWKAEKPRGVLFIDGEMPGVVLKERFAQTITGMDGSCDNANLKIITPDLEQEHGMPDLATFEGQQRVEPFITKDIALIVSDNISTLCGNIQENKSDTWRPIQEWLLKLRARGKSVLLVHHDGKGGGQRGTSKKEDILDTVIQLRHPAQYTPTDGAVFEVHFMKNRGLYGEDVEPFEASLNTFEGLALWTTRKLEDSLLEKVKKLLDDGYQQKDISEELGKSKGYISKIVKRIKAEE